RTPFYVNRQNRAWTSSRGRARLGAVSSFGMSGTNAHVVLEGYEKPPVDNTCEVNAPCFLLALSAKSEAALAQRMEDVLAVLEDSSRAWDSRALAELSYTLLVHRQHFSHRCAVLVGSAAEAIERLRKVRLGEKVPLAFTGKVNPGVTAQPALQQYATELLGRLAQQQ